MFFSHFEFFCAPVHIHIFKMVTRWTLSKTPNVLYLLLYCPKFPNLNYTDLQLSKVFHWIFLIPLHISKMWDSIIPIWCISKYKIHSSTLEILLLSTSQFPDVGHIWGQQRNTLKRHHKYGWRRGVFLCKIWSDWAIRKTIPQFLKMQ